ncbi:hypothetical protein FOZ62_000090, partial [Perkinsus olseni]
ALSFIMMAPLSSPSLSPQGCLALMAAEGLFLLVLQFDTKHFSDFAARKMCHSLSGLMMLFLPPQYILCRLYVYAVVIVGLVMTWQLVPALPKWRFGDYGDIGITVYLIIVGFWFCSEYPVAVLAPIFFADPSGAVIGKWASRNLPEYNPTWVGKKTVIGSLAVFVVTFLTLYRPLGFIPRLLVRRPF